MRRLSIIVMALGLLLGGNVMRSATLQPAAAENGRQVIERLMAALEAEDRAAADALLADDVVLVHAMTFSGRLMPEFVATGRAATLAYLDTVFTNFAQVRFVDPVYTVNEDGRRVVVETHGDFILAGSGGPYQNVYVFRFELVAGQITFINEYANPVTASAALGVPLGTPAAAD